jgi:hypothetical protein
MLVTLPVGTMPGVQCCGAALLRACSAQPQALHACCGVILWPDWAAICVCDGLLNKGGCCDACGGAWAAYYVAGWFGSLLRDNVPYSCEVEARCGLFSCSAVLYSVQDYAVFHV